MFTVPGRGSPGRPLTGRAQVFTGAGLRPVVVVTKFPSDAGGSIINEAEAFAQESWRRFAPDDDEPPLWIGVHLGDQADDGRDTPDARRCIDLVGFAKAGGRYRLEQPCWRPLQPEQLMVLVGQDIDLSRGVGREAFPPPPAEPVPIYRVRWLLTLPRVDADLSSCLNGSAPAWRRVVRMLAPRRGGRECCDYHRGDWVTVARVAVRLVRRAQRRHIAGDEVADFVVAQPEAHQLTIWEHHALGSLVSPAIGIDITEDNSYFINGRHRAQAMIDAGVRRTVVIVGDGATPERANTRTRRT